MTKIFLDEIIASSGLDAIVKKEELSPVTDLSKADLAVYGGSLESFMNKLVDLKEEKISLKTLLPFKTFAHNANARPPGFSQADLINKQFFESEAIGEVSSKIDQLLSAIDRDNAFGDLSRYMKSNAIELVQNALIHKKISNSSGQIELCLYETSGSYGISVSDPFGALTSSKTLEKLVRVYRERSYETKESGAGLGLYMVLNASDSVVIEIKRNKSSRVCCIMNKYKRLKDFKGKSPALHLIEE